MATVTISGETLGTAANLTGAACLLMDDSTGTTVHYTAATLRTKLFAGGTGYTAGDPLVAGNGSFSGTLTAAGASSFQDVTAKTVNNSTSSTVAGAGTTTMFVIPSDPNAQFLVVGNVYNVGGSMAMALVTNDNSGVLQNAQSIISAGGFSWTISGQNLQIVNTGGGANFRSALLRIR